MNNKTLLENLRCIPDFPRKGINFRDVTTLYKNAECMQIMLDEMYELYKDKGITKIVGVESRGFVMAAALAARLKAGVVLARKPGKLPSTVIKESFSKEYGVDTVEMHLDSIDENDLEAGESIPSQKNLHELHHRDYGRRTSRARPV